MNRHSISMSFSSVSKTHLQRTHESKPRGVQSFATHRQMTLTFSYLIHPKEETSVEVACQLHVAFHMHVATVQPVRREMGWYFCCQLPSFSNQ